MKYTKEIFDILSRGGFICSNSVRRLTKTIYDAIEDNYEEYREYYSGIGFNLESGNGYYYFSRQESRVELDAKLDRFVRWIDRLDFLKTFNNVFGPGFTFRTSNILEQIAADMELKEKAMHLYAEKLKLDEVVDKLVDELEKIGFVEKENELDGTWKVTSAFHYIEELVDCLTVSEEVRNEVLE
ncbi:MAG TPA: hypothetical protein DDX40_04810 [Rikenellaceae bacterium]|mgnify:FL=1|nr:hypothetical protein [Rikenellaceae bacterium]